MGLLSSLDLGSNYLFADLPLAFPQEWTAIVGLKLLNLSANQLGRRQLLAWNIRGSMGDCMGLAGAPGHNAEVAGRAPPRHALHMGHGTCCGWLLHCTRRL